MPAWRVNLSPKSENVIAGCLSHSFKKRLTIALQDGGCKSAGGCFSDAKCFDADSMQHYMLNNEAARPKTRRLVITAGLPRRP